MDRGDKEVVEDIILDMQHVSERYLTNQKGINEKMLTLSVSEGLEYLEALRDSFLELEDEQLKKVFRLNMFVPIQLAELIKIREEEK